VAVGHQLGTSNVNSYDPGQEGKAERVLDRPVVQQPAAESVLVQSLIAGQTYANDPEMRQAVREVVAALRALPGSATGIQSPLTSPSLVNTGQDGGRSALVTSTWPASRARRQGGRARPERGRPPYRRTIPG